MGKNSGRIGLANFQTQTLITDFDTRKIIVREFGLMQVAVAVWCWPMSGSNDDIELVLRDRCTCSCCFHLQVHRIQRVGFTFHLCRVYGVVVS